MRPLPKHANRGLTLFVLTLLALTIPPTLPAGTVLNTNDSGPGSLRDVIATSPSGATITFDQSLSGQTITLTNGQITITNDVTIDASSLPGGIIVSGNSTARVFNVASNTVTTFSSLSVTQGRVTFDDPSGGSGGGIFNAGVLTLTNCYLWRNYAGGNGGAIYNAAGSVTLHRSTLTTNFADDFGAGICNVGGDVVINHSILSSNRIGEVAGGAIYVTNGSITMNNSTIFANTARFGGGIAVHHFGNLTITNCDFYQNFTASGGCIDSFGIVALSDSAVFDNVRARGVLNQGTIVMERTEVMRNPGGIINYGTAILNACTISSNSGSRGGGIHNLGTVSLVNSTISKNAADLGGGIYNGNGTNGSLIINHSTISGNSATNDGGGVFNEAGTLELGNSIVVGNFAPTNSNIGGIVTSWLGNNLTNGAPLPAPLDDYGGPTPTMPPLPGSPAIEAALFTTNTPATDQRGAPRPNGPLPDLGSVEAFAFSSFPLLDSDCDGVDDRLEPAYGLVVGNNDSNADSDNDGSLDAMELFNMTNPADPTDNFRIMSFGPSSGFDSLTNPVFNVSFKTFPGLSYELEFADSVAGLQSVTNSQIVSSNYAAEIEVLLPANQGFVRAKRN